MHIPLYSTTELEKLLKYWSLGSLDAIHSPGCAVPGVHNCDRYGYGLRPQGLLQRYTIDDVNSILAEMGMDADPLPLWTAILLMRATRGITLEAIASALEWPDCHYAQGVLEQAQNEFMRRLLAI